MPKKLNWIFGCFSGSEYSSPKNVFSDFGKNTEANAFLKEFSWTSICRKEMTCSELPSSSRIHNSTKKQQELPGLVSSPWADAYSHLEIHSLVIWGDTKGQSFKYTGIWTHHQQSQGRGYDWCISFCVSHLIAYLLSCLQDTLSGATARKKKKKKTHLLKYYPSFTIPSQETIR